MSPRQFKSYRTQLVPFWYDEWYLADSLHKSALPRYIHLYLSSPFSIYLIIRPFRFSIIRTDLIRVIRKSRYSRFTVESVG